MTALDKTIREPADQVRNMEIERLDRLWFAVYQSEEWRRERFGTSIN